MDTYIVAVWTELLGKVTSCPGRYLECHICYELQDASYEMQFKTAIGYKFLKLFSSFTGWAHEA